MRQFKIFSYYIVSIFCKKLANANCCNKRSKFLKEFKRSMRKMYNIKNARGKKNPKTPKASKVYNEFCNINSKYWEEKKFSENSPTILVEGLFAESGPNYVVRIGAISKTLEKIKDSNLLVLLRISPEREPYKKQIWQSFKMNNFISIFDDVFKNLSYFKKLEISFLSNALYFWSKILFLLNQREQFLQFSFKGVRLGDILYDDIIKETPIGVYTINRITKEHKSFFRKLFIYFYVAEFLYEKYKFEYYVTTHIQYIAYGLVARYFAHRGAIIIETTDDMLFIYDDYNTYPRFHSAVKNMIMENFAEIYNNDTLQEEAKAELNKRFTGQVEQIDVQMAYVNKQNYSKQLLKEKLGINNDNPIVFVFAHIFADTPQGSSDKMLFVDYYQWLKETIKYIKNIDDVNWVIKPHPSSKAYGEEGAIAELVHKCCKPTSSVFLCPDDFSTVSVLDCAKAIVTVQGTVGLEYSCVGIPVVICGSAFYSGFGFTYEPNTKQEYFKQLKNIKDIKSLSENQMKSAITVYKGFCELGNKNFSLIDTRLKDLVWGCHCVPNILGAFELMSKRLQKTDPKTQFFVYQIEKYLTKINAGKLIS